MSDTIKIKTSSRLADEPISIQVTGAEPNIRLMIYATTISAKGTLFRAYATYQSDAEGTIDLRRDSSVGGSYEGVFPSGLFATMKPTSRFERLVTRDPSKATSFLISVWSTSKDTAGVPDTILHQLTSNSDECVIKPSIKPLCVAFVERHFMAEGVKREEIKVGRIRGVLYIPAGCGPFPAVMDLSGAAGGMLEYRAALLASRGILGLALAYMRYMDLPKSMNELEIDYLEEAADFLFNRSETDKASGGVGGIGSSKGAEFLTGGGCFIPRLTALFLINGHISSIGGFTHHRKLSLTFSPTPIDPTRVILYEDGTLNVYNAIYPVVPADLQIGLYRKLMVTEYTRSVTDPTESFKLNPAEGDLHYKESLPSMYPLEKVTARCLLIAGEEDQNWRSVLNAYEFKRRARKGLCEVITYPGTGHYIDPPCAPFEFSSYHPLANGVTVWGGNAYQHQLAQEDAWTRCIKFFKKTLTTHVSHI